MKRTRWRDLRDAALGMGFLLGVFALISYELRGCYEDIRLMARGTGSFAYVTRARASWASKNGIRPGNRVEARAT